MVTATVYTHTSVSYPPLQIAIAFVIGGFLLFFGIKKISSWRKLKEFGVKAEGVVFRLEQSNNARDQTYYPVIRFLTAEKEWITKRYDGATTSGKYKEGDKVNILYNNDDAENFIIDDKINMLAGPILIGLGIVFILYAIYGYLTL